MTERADLLKEIDKLSPKYFGKLFDYASFLRQKSQIETDDQAEAYQAMAADTEREKEALEWCNSYFGPVCSK